MTYIKNIQKDTPRQQDNKKTRRQENNSNNDGSPSIQACICSFCFDRYSKVTRVVQGVQPTRVTVKKKTARTIVLRLASWPLQTPRIYRLAQILGHVHRNHHL